MEDTQKKKSLQLGIGLLAILLLILVWLIFDQTVDRSGWVEKDGLYSYRDFHGKKVTGWLELEDRVCYFDENARYCLANPKFKKSRQCLDNLVSSLEKSPAIRYNLTVLR